MIRCCMTVVQKELKWAHIPFGTVVRRIQLAHNDIHIMEEVPEEGLLGTHLICSLLAILHGSIPRGQGKHEPHLTDCKIFGESIPEAHSWLVVPSPGCRTT